MDCLNLEQPFHIFVCGGHSVGKTTLVNRISKFNIKIQFHQITEIARTVLTECKFTREDLQDQEKRKFYQTTLLHRQAQEERKLENVHYIADRGIDSLVYSKHYVGTSFYETLLQTPEAKECIETYKQSLIFLLKPHEVCFKDDGIRMKPDMNDLLKLTNEFENVMKEQKIPYFVIDSSDIETRTQTAELVIKYFLNKSQ